MTVNGACFSKRVRLLKPAEYSRVFNNAKRAVDRNRIKRLIRESFRLHQLELPAADFVVMAKPVTKSVDNHEIFKSLEHHWNRLIKQCAKSSSQ